MATMGTILIDLQPGQVLDAVQRLASRYDALSRRCEALEADVAELRREVHAHDLHRLADDGCPHH